jgi:hypothetical protein
MTEAEEARYHAFVDATEPAERDSVAFCQFEEAVHNAAECAALTNACDGGAACAREQDGLRLILSQMLFKVLPHVELGTLITEARGIGYALRHNLIPPCCDALDAITDTAAFEDLAERGYAAERAYRQTK